MSVLVTGATGMFDGMITDKLSQGDVPVLAMSRSESRAASVHDWACANLGTFE